MKISLIWSLIWISPIVANAAEPYPDNGMKMRTFYGCLGLLYATANFCDANSTYATDNYGCFCVEPNQQASFMGCAHIGNRDNMALKQEAVKQCQEYNVTLTVKELDEAYKLYTEKAVNVSDIPDFNYSIAVNQPILVDETQALLYRDSYNQFLGNYSDSLYYGAGILGYWLIVLIIAMVANWMKVLAPGLVKNTVGPGITWIRRNITLPAIHRRKADAKPFLRVLNFLVPTRLETLILLGFLAVTIACQGANIKVVPNDPIFLTSATSLGRQIAVRAGILVSCNVPLLILFAGRNNFLQWLTRWDFATFVLYHRWIGRVIVALTFVHAIGYTVADWDYYAETFSENYVIWGIIALIAGCFILVQGLLVLRRKWYEAFLVIHIILAALYLGGAWVHVNTLGYVWFYYASAAVWIFDRAVRLCRLIIFGFPMARVELEADDTVKVVVPKPDHWKSIPGGHAFVHFLLPSCFWQSHPFTFTETVETKNQITLYCKIKGGVTFGLHKYLANFPGKVTNIRVGIEGPYGESTPARYYDNSVFIAGGNGIPGIYSEVYDLGLRNTGNTIKLIWIVRDHASLTWFHDELSYLKDKHVQTTIYLTKVSGNKSDSSDEKTDSKETGESTASEIEVDLDHIEFRYGRPNLEDIIQEEVQESKGSTAFVTCGHPMMVDDIRYTVCKNLNNEKRVDFYEQIQVWA